MPKLKKAISGVPAGAIYPVEYAKGDECPPELLDAAIALGAVKAPKVPDTPTPDTDPEEEDEDGEVDAGGDVSGDAPEVVVEDGDDPVAADAAAGGSAGGGIAGGGA